MARVGNGKLRIGFVQAELTLRNLHPKRVLPMQIEQGETQRIL